MGVSELRPEGGAVRLGPADISSSTTTGPRSTAELPQTRPFEDEGSSSGPSPELGSAQKRYLGHFFNSQISATIDAAIKQWGQEFVEKRFRAVWDDPQARARVLTTFNSNRYAREFLAPQTQDQEMQFKVYVYYSVSQDLIAAMPDQAREPLLEQIDAAALKEAEQTLGRAGDGQAELLAVHRLFARGKAALSQITRLARNGDFAGAKALAASLRGDASMAALLGGVGIDAAKLAEGIETQEQLDRLNSELKRLETQASELAKEGKIEGAGGAKELIRRILEIFRSTATKELFEKAKIAPDKIAEMIEHFEVRLELFDVDKRINELLKAGKYDEAIEYILDEKNGGAVYELLKKAGADPDRIISRIRIEKRLNTLIGEGKINEAIAYAQANRQLLGEKETAELVQKLRSSDAVSFSVPSSWSARGEMSSPVLVFGSPRRSDTRRERVARAQRLLQETVNPATNQPYLAETHPADGRMDEATAAAMYSFTRRNGSPKPFEDTVKDLAQDPDGIMELSFQWGDQEDKDLSSVHASQTGNFRIVPLESLVGGTRLGSAIRQWVPDNVNGTVYYAIAYLRTKFTSPSQKAFLSMMHDKLFAAEKPCSAEEIERLLSMCGKVEIDPEGIKALRFPGALASQSRVCVNIYSGRAADLPKTEGIQILVEPAFVPGSRRIVLDPMGASSRTPVAYYLNGLRTSGIQLPGLAEGGDTPDFFTSAHLGIIADRLSSNSVPYVHYNMKDDPELVKFLTSSAEKSHPALKSLLLRIAGSDLTMNRAYISPEEREILVRFAGDLSSDPLGQKLQILILSITSDNPGMTVLQAARLKEFAATNQGARIDISALRSAAPDNEGVQALLWMLEMNASSAQDTNKAWYAVYPTMAAAIPGKPADAQMIELKRLYTRDNTLAQRLSELNADIERLRGTAQQRAGLTEEQRSACAAELLPKLAERDAIQAFIDSDVITYDFFKWILTKYVANDPAWGRLAGAVDTVCAYANQYLFQVSYEGLTDNARRNLVHAREILRNAEQNLKKVGLFDVWKTTGFLSLRPGAGDYENLTPEQRNELEKIRQALSVLISLIVDTKEGTVDPTPNTELFGRAMLSIVGLGQDPSLEVRMQIKGLCMEYYGEFKDLDNDYYNRFLAGTLTDAEKKSLTVFDLKILEKLLQQIERQFEGEKKKRIGVILSRIKGLIAGNKGGNVIDIKAGSPEYALLIELSELLVSGDDLTVGDPFSASASGAGGTGFASYMNLDLGFLEAIANNLTEEERATPLGAALAVGIRAVKDLMSNPGAVPGEFLSQQIYLRVLMPFFIFVGLPVSSIRSVMHSMFGDKSWDETGRSVKHTAAALALFPRFAPLWYRQAVKEAEDGHYGIALAMAWAINYFAVRGGWNSIWGRTLQPATELFKILANVPGAGKLVKMLPVGWERRAFGGLFDNRVTRARVYLNGEEVQPLIMGVRAVLDPWGTGEEFFLRAEPESNWARRLGASAARGYNYLIDYPFNLAMLGVSSAADRADSRRQALRLSVWMREDGVSASSDPEAEFARQLNKLNAGAVLFDNTSTRAAVLVSESGFVAPAGQGSLAGNLELRSLVLGAFNSSSNPLLALADGTGLRLTVNVEGEQARLRVAEIRVTSDVAMPSFMIRRPSGLVDFDMGEVVLLLPESFLDPADQFRARQLDTLIREAQTNPVSLANMPSAVLSVAPEMTVLAGEALDIAPEVSARWQGLVDSAGYTTKSGARFLLHPNQMAALEAIAQGGNMLLNIGCGQGKTEIGILAAMERAARGQKVHVITANDALVEEWVERAKRFGLSIGVIRSGMGIEEKSAAYRCNIVVGADQLVFDTISGEFAPGEIERQVLIIDEADQKLIEMALTSYYISGGLNGAGNPIAARAADARAQKQWQDSLLRLGRMQSGTHFDPDTLRLLPQGEEFIRGEVGSDEYPAEQRRIERLILAVQMRAEREAITADPNHPRNLTLQYNFDIVNGEIVIINSEGFYMRGHRWEGGIDEAIRTVFGLKVPSCSGTLGTITFSQFMRLYSKADQGQVIGYSGTMREDWQLIANQYLDFGFGLVIVPNHIPQVNITYDNVSQRFALEAAGRPQLTVDLNDPAGMRQALDYVRDSALTEPAERTKIKLVDHACESQEVRALVEDLLVQITGEFAPFGAEAVALVRRQPQLLYANRDQKLARIAVDAVEEALALRGGGAGRPVLVHAASIEEVELLRGMIEAEARRRLASATDPGERIKLNDLLSRIRTLTAENVGKEGPMLVRAAGEGLSILLATTAGRGTDIPIHDRAKVALLLDNIVLTEEAVRSGGLHVMVSEQDTTERLTTQKVERAARQADPGSSRVYASLDDPVFRHLDPEYRENLRAEISRLGGVVDVSDVELNFRQAINDALEIARREAQTEIERTNFFADAARQIETVYHQMFGEITKGNVMINILLENTCSALLDSAGILKGQQLEEAQRRSLETALKRLTGADIVDLSGLDGLTRSQALERLSERLCDVFSARKGNDAGFYDAAVKVGGMGLWSARMTELFMRNYSAHRERVSRIQAELENTAMPEGADGRDIFRARVAESFELMMQNLRIEIFNAVFPQGAFSKPWERFYNLSRLRIEIRSAAADSPALRAGGSENEAALAASERAGIDIDPDRGGAGQAGPVAPEQMAVISDHSRDMNAAERTAVERTVENLRDRGLVDAVTAKKILDGEITIRVVEHPVWWRAGGDAVYHPESNVIYVRPGTVPEGRMTRTQAAWQSFISLFISFKPVEAALTHEGIEIALRAGADAAKLSEADMHALAAQVEEAQKVLSNRGIMPRTPVPAAPSVVASAPEAAAARPGEASAASAGRGYLTSPDGVVSLLFLPNGMLGRVVESSGELPEVGFEAVRTELRASELGIKIAQDGTQREVSNNDNVSLFESGGRIYKRNSQGLFVYDSISRSWSNATGAPEQLARMSAEFAGTAITFVAVAGAIDLLTRLVTGNVEREGVWSSIKMDAKHNITGVSIFTFQQKTAELFGLGHLSGDFVFGMGAFRGITDERSANQFIAEFGLFKAGTGALSTAAAARMIPIPWLRSAIGLGLGLAAAKAGKEGAGWLYDSFEFLSHMPQGEILLTLAEMKRAWDPSEIAGRAVADFLFPLANVDLSVYEDDPILLERVQAANLFVESTVALSGNAAAIWAVRQGASLLGLKGLFGASAGASTAAAAGALAVGTLAWGVVTAELALIYLGVQQNRMLDGFAREAAEEQNNAKRRAAGLVFSGWITGGSYGQKVTAGLDQFFNTRNVPARQIQIANRLMFSTAQDSFAVDIDMSDDGRLLPMYGSKGYIRFPSDLSIIDEAFERARLSGKFPNQAAVEKWLNERLPNWLYLLKKQHSDPRRDNGRGVFRRCLPHIYKTQTIQSYTGKIDRGEIIPINLAAIYFNDPSLLKIENGKVAGFTIPPERYFAQKGMRNYTTPQEQKRRAEQRRIINEFISKNLSTKDEPEYSSWAAYLQTPDDVKWADAKHQALLKSIQIKACDNALAVTAKNITAAEQNLAAIDRNIEGVRSSMSSVSSLLFNVSQLMAGAKLNIVREKKKGPDGKIHSEIVVTMGEKGEEIFRGGKAAEGFGEEIFLLYRNVLVPIFRVLEGAGLAKNLSLGCAEAKTYEEFVRLGGLAEGSNAGRFVRDAGVIMDLLSKQLSSSYRGTWPVNSINAVSLTGSLIPQVQRAAEMLRSVPVPLPLAQVSVKSLDGRPALFIDGIEIKPSDPNYNRNAALFYEKTLKPFMVRLISEGKLQGPVPGSFLEAADQVLSVLEEHEMTSPMFIDCGVLSDAPVTRGRVNIVRVKTQAGTTKSVEWWIKTDNGQRLLDPTNLADKDLIDYIHENVISVLKRILGAGGKGLDPSSDAGILMNHLSKINGFGTCNSLNSEVAEKAAATMDIPPRVIMHASRVLAERQLETMYAQRKRLSGQRDGALADRRNIQALRAQFGRM
ncbi:MAG: DEAD/DEAH box helicase [Candidatus Margulisiibacteriota bacterium]